MTDLLAEAEQQQRQQIRRWQLRLLLIGIAGLLLVSVAVTAGIGITMLQDSYRHTPAPVEPPEELVFSAPRLYRSDDGIAATIRSADPAISLTRLTAVGAEHDHIILDHIRTRHPDLRVATVPERITARALLQADAPPPVLLVGGDGDWPLGDTGDQMLRWHLRQGGFLVLDPATPAHHQHLRAAITTGILPDAPWQAVAADDPLVKALAGVETGLTGIRIDGRWVALLLPAARDHTPLLAHLLVAIQAPTPAD